MNDPHDNALDDKAVLEDALAAKDRHYGGLAEEDLSDEALERFAADRRAADFTDPELPPPGPPPLAPGETATLIGTSVLGDTYDESTGEVLKDAPGWDKTTRTILDRDGLEWAGRRLRDVEEALAENHRAAAAEFKELEERLRKAQERHAEADAPLLASRSFFDAAIRAYADSHRAELLKGRRGKTARLSSGLVLAWSTEARGGTYRWDEKMKPAEREAALLAWAQDYDARLGTDFVGKRPALKPLAVVTKHLNSHHPRQDVPGLEYVPEHERLDVTVEE